MDVISVKRIVSARLKDFKVGHISSLSVSRLGMGENNLNFLVAINKSRFVIRINLRPELEDNLEREFLALKCVPAGIGPMPVFIDRSKKIIPNAYSVLTYVEGKPVKNWTRKHLRLHAQKLAFLHKKTYPYWSDFVTKHKRLDIVKRYQGHVADFDMQFDKDSCSIIANVEKYLEDHKHLFLSLSRFSLIHMDTCINNILFTKDDVKYIDWEWVRIRDPAEDLSRHYYPDFSLMPWAILLNGSRWEYFLDEYLKLRKDKTLKERVKVWNTYYLLTDMLYFQWKIANFTKEKSDLSKKHYESAIRLMKRSLNKRFQ
ncbi:MAG: aminoglycoside phosphotransferase family protein [Nanoarchaeota archaeon]